MAKLPNALLAPWAITESGLKLVASIASRDEFFADIRQKALQAKDGEPLDNTRSVTVRDGVAVIPISGPLFRHAGIMADISGATSYESLRKDFQTAIDDISIKAVVFDIDSPGGEVHGCGELSKAIFDARGSKPIIGYVSGMCASAAYWLGSAADALVADASAMVGSIGVRTMLVDDSKADEQAGIKEYDIVSDQSPLKAVDASDSTDRARVKASLTAMAAVFIDDVARNRGVSASLVAKEYGKGDTFVGQQGVGAGVIDRLGDLESVLSELAFGRPQSTGASMKPKATMGKEKCDGCARAMDDDDELYCAACHGTPSASAFELEVLALVGESDQVKALAKLTGIKQAASEIEELRARIAKQEAESAAAAFDSAIDKAKRASLLAASDSHKRNKAALAFKGKPDALESLNAFLSAFDPLIPGAVSPVAQVVGAEPGQASPLVVLTDDEKKIAAQMGITLEALAKNKARRIAMSRLPVQTDDEEDAA